MSDDNHGSVVPLDQWRAPKSTNRKCARCGGEWWRVTGVVFDASTDSIVGYTDDAECTLCAESADRSATQAAVRKARADGAREFAAWVATNRAYNGSDHKHGQALYNECLNVVLPTWAAEFTDGTP